MAFDQEPELNVETRNALLERAVGEGRIVAAAHIGEPGRIERVETAFDSCPCEQAENRR